MYVVVWFFSVLILEKGLHMQNWLRYLYSPHLTLEAGDWKTSAGGGK